MFRSFVFLFSLAFVSTAFGQVNLRDIFSRPLILGASVSADHGAVSPGKKLALQFTAPSRIHTIARSGGTSDRIWRAVRNRAFEDRTVVVALDLFFWDSNFGSQRTFTVLEDVVAKARANGSYLVLGDIPRLVGTQTMRDTLNTAIYSQCSKYSKCKVLSLDRLHRNMVSRGGYQVGRKFYSLRELLPDGLHPSDMGSQVIADHLRRLF